MRNAGLDEAQAGIKIARRNINNLRYADDTTLMSGREEELKNLLMKVKEESEKGGLKLNVQKSKIMAFGPITHVLCRRTVLFIHPIYNSLQLLILNSQSIPLALPLGNHKSVLNVCESVSDL